MAAAPAVAIAAIDALTHPDESIAQTGVVNLYSSRHYGTDNAIYEGFTKKTGIKVNLVEAAADKLIERIKSEGANSPADLFITVDAGNLWRAQQLGILQPVRSKILETAIPASLREPQGNWFGFTKRARVIVYNKNKVDPDLLSSYEDLASPRWKGRIVSRTSGYVYNLSLVGSILVANGKAKTEAWAKGVVANFARSPEGNDTAQLKSIASGIGDLTFVNSYYLVRLAKSSKPEEVEIAKKLGVIFPNQGDRGTHINLSGGGVVKTSKNKASAIKLLEYLASRQAQDIFARSNNEYPAVRGVPLDPVLASFGQFKEDPINAAEFGKLNGDALKLMDRAGWK